LKLPRDENASELIKKLQKLGYQPDRQTGSHIRLITYENGRHSITIPNHKPLKIGTLNSILLEIAEHFKISKDQLISRLW
jgi:predicted RNA binding protein YcfA (HicA-like mRNA interferase family)